MSDRTAERSLGYAMACFRSIVLTQDAIRGGAEIYHWYAPGWNRADLDNMPNGGHCQCGMHFWASDVYHFFASCDEKWHTRSHCTKVTA